MSLTVKQHSGASPLPTTSSSLRAWRRRGSSRYARDTMSELELDIHDFAETFMKAFEGKDQYTRRHSKRVSETAERIARGLGFTEEQCYFMHVAGHFPDIGKINVPDAILLKTRKIRPQEMEVMKLCMVVKGWNT